MKIEKKSVFIKENFLSAFIAQSYVYQTVTTRLLLYTV